MSDFDNDYLWTPTATADPDVVRLETALRTLERPIGKSIRPLHAATLPTRAQRSRRSSRELKWPVAAIAAALLLVVALTATRRITSPWAVVMLRDSGAIPTLKTRSPLNVGEWIVTDALTRARLNVGSLGKAEIGPSSRLRLVRAALTEHRLELAEGTLHARIWAPPRFFLVETVSALAVDLGCVYTLRVDRMGEGYLRVESGEVELVGPAHVARVPAGNTVHVNRAMGPGLPYPDNASSEFIAALTTLERAHDDSSSASALESLLTAATPTTTITLWHLLQRVDVSQRGQVITRLAQLSPLPASAPMESVMRFDSQSMEAWRADLEPKWSSEEVHFWKRWWRALWRVPPNKLIDAGRTGSDSRRDR